MSGPKRLDSFLCCFTLETGGLIIGWIGVISSLISAALCILMVVLLAGDMLNSESLEQMGFGKEGGISQDELKTMINGYLMFTYKKIEK